MFDPNKDEMAGLRRWLEREGVIPHRPTLREEVLHVAGQLRSAGLPWSLLGIRLKAAVRDLK